MLRHNIKLALRGFKKDKSTFTINMLGLSTGLACTILIFMWVMDEVNMNKFHENDDQLYQVMSNIDVSDGIMTWRTTPGHLGEALMNEIPEIKTASVSAVSRNNYTVALNDKELNVRGQYVTDNYFNVFSFELLEGNKEKIFPNKNGAAISEKIALKLFKTTENLIGKTVSFETPYEKGEAVISSVFKNTKRNSSQQFDVLFPYESYSDIRGDELHWGNLDVGTFVILKEGTDLAALNKKIAGFLKTKKEDFKVDIFLQQYSQLYLHGNFENGVASGGRITYVRLFSLIALFILLIACINFMNLSTANATKKFKEIGVKKTIGANRKTLISQYLGESLMLSFLSLSIALLLIYLCLSEFNIITGKELSMNFAGSSIIGILAITFITGIISGSYPALYLSGINPVQILKGKMNNSLREIWARKGLVVFQFSLSLVLIVSVFVVYKQIQFIQTKNLGFNKENIIHFPISSESDTSPDVTIDEIKKITGVINASSMNGNFINRSGFTDGPFDWEGKSPEQEAGFSFLSVNYEILEMLNFEMTAGRTFSKEFSEESTKIIFNEAGIKSLGFKDPIGKQFTLWGNNYEIVGVVKDFHFNTLYDNINPFFIRYSDAVQSDKIIVKIEPGKEQSTLALLEAFHKKNNQNAVFSYQFLDSNYQQLYESEQRVATLSKYFAGFAIIISCLGLFGLAAFTAQRRVKEISIRKVLGANAFSIIHLLTMDFTKMVIIALLIGLPISYLIAQKWLNDFAFHIDLSIWFFVGASIIILVIAWLTVALQTAKAASVNPAKNLKE